MTDSEQNIFNRDEAAAYLRISVGWLDQLTKDGKIACSRLGEGKRRRVIYCRADLNAYIESHRKPVAPEHTTLEEMQRVTREFLDFN